MLDHGRKIAEGIPKEIRNNPVVIEAYLGTKKEGGNADALGRTFKCILWSDQSTYRDCCAV